MMAFPLEKHKERPMADAFLLSAARTPIGKYLGALADVPAPQLGAYAVAEAIKRAKAPAAQVDEVIMGNVIQAGLGQNPARQAALKAGLPDTIAAVTINKVCGSGLKAVMLAAQAIRAGDADLIVAGGQESMSRAPHLLCSARAAEKLGVKPLARIVAYATSGVAPKDIFIAPVLAVRQVLEKAKLKLGDIDLFELNEAFAAQMLACGKDLKLDEAKVNVHGGAIALGHPIGASGARTLVTLLYAMEQRGGKRGLTSLCLGGGNAVALVAERL